MKIISLANTSSGNGKSVASVALAEAIGICKKNVLLLDMDPDGKVTRLLQKKSSKDFNLARMQRNSDYLGKIIKKNGDYLGFVPANPEISLFTDDKAENKDLNQILSDNLRSVEKRFDYCVINTPSGYNLCFKNAIEASDIVIIPITPNYFSEKKLKENLELVDKGKTKILITDFDKENDLSREVEAKIRKKCPKMTMDTVIMHNFVPESHISSGSVILSQSLFSLKTYCFIHLAKEIFGYEKI